MPPFDVLEPTTKLFGAKLLEASAGTGKTFAIEHLFVRLLLEAPDGEEPLRIDQILAITFTRAAAREMRMRIRANIQKTLAMLQGDVQWPYLEAHRKSDLARHRIEEALVGFDRAQIFTIHGFCQRILSQFSLEANVSIESHHELAFRRAIRPSLLDFLQEQQVLCPEQIGRVLSKKKNVESLSDALLNAPCPEEGGSFAEDLKAFGEAVRQGHFPAIAFEELLSDFHRMKPQFKISDFKGVDFEEQLQSLAILLRRDDEAALRVLIGWQGSLFEFLSPDNRKLRVKDEFSSPILIGCAQKFRDMLQKMSDPKILFRRLRFEWQKHFEKYLEEKKLFSPDFLLEKMRRALENPEFIGCIRQKYRAAIVDEFQDTDAVQWEIFRKIFFNNTQLFYLVGDPKQSIYRFRQADLYTYFQAKKTLGEDAHYSLDTNYRSTPEMISALNNFFSAEHVEPWLLLPREQRQEAYHPVRAGSLQRWDPLDGKRPLEFFLVEDLGAATLSFVYHEILHLKQHVQHFGSFAILVKDRQQASEARSYLQARNLPCYTKNLLPLSQSGAAYALEELFQAIFFPKDSSAMKIFLTGPFVSLDGEADGMPFLSEVLNWKSVLEEEGLPAFFDLFLKTSLNGGVVRERIEQQGKDFSLDVFQIIEQLLSIQFPSHESIKRFFAELKAGDPDDEAAVRRRIENDEEAIQIMTMHASKGLEFDIVFVLGAAAKTPVEEEEALESEAEKLRQLYVALTRAKLRQYIPLVLQSRSLKGSESPLDLFWRRSKLGQVPQEIVQKLSEQNAGIGLQREKSSLEKLPAETAVSAHEKPSETKIFLTNRKIFSYSALSRHEENAARLEANDSLEKTLHTLPRGAETGTCLHKIFERVLKEEKEVHQIVSEELRLSLLQEWALPIETMVDRVMSMPLVDGIALKDCPHRRVEVEFLFSQQEHCLKGFIDVIFLCNGRLYILDWKSNYLGDGDDAYSEDHLRKAMDAGDYWFQAFLYAKALERSWPNLPLGGIFYLFVRGVHAPSRGALFFQPPSIAWEKYL